MPDLPEALAELGPAFGLGRPETAPRAIETGHINDTFVAAYAGGGAGTRRFVHQRINVHVFPRPEALMQNLVLVSEAISDAVRARGLPDPERRSLRYLRTSDGALLHRDAEGGLWRTAHFVEGSRSFDAPPDEGFARRAARAFGEHLGDLASLSTDALEPSIPGFHDLDARVAQLEHAIRADVVGQADRVAEEIDATRALSERIRARLAQAGAADAPLRVVHNDCKINNLLVDAESREPLCVIDLDTVMAGRVLYDFGELARSSACTGDEDEADVARIALRPGIYLALAEGFREGLGSLVAASERATLPLGPPRMALENAIRFLTDHLEGGVYFRPRRPDQNLHRNRAQRRRAEILLAAQPSVAGVFAAARTDHRSGG